MNMEKVSSDKIVEAINDLDDTAQQTAAVATQNKIEEVNKQPVQEVKKTNKNAKGIVDCVALKIRKEPTFEGGLLTVEVKSTEVTINGSASTEEYYNITTVSGVTGFCLKKYIKVQ